MKKENKHRKRIPQPFAGGNPFSHSFFLKIGEEEVEVKLVTCNQPGQYREEDTEKTN